MASSISWILCAFLSGVLLHSFVSIPLTFVSVLFGVVVGFLSVLWRQINRSTRFGLLLFLVFIGGTFYFSVYENVVPPRYEGSSRKVVLEGTVLRVMPRLQSQELIIQDDRQKLLVVSRLYPHYRYGDVVKISGILQSLSTTGRFFKDGISGEIIFPEIRILSYRPPSHLRSFLFSIKDRFELVLHRIIPEPHASLASGMLLGSEGLVEKNIIDAFRNSGTIHILVLSGYNITLVGAAVLALVSFVIPQSVAWAISGIAIVAFTLMTGAEAPAVRAAIMAIVGLFANHTGRLGNSALSLLWAGSLMVFFDPFLLRYDGGFQLSFLATLGLILFSRWFLARLWFLPQTLGIRESAASSFAAQLFVLPLLISWGRAVSLWSPLANIVIVSLVPAVMFFSFFGALVGFIVPLAGSLIVAPAYFLIAFQVAAAQFFGG